MAYTVSHSFVDKSKVFRSNKRNWFIAESTTKDDKKRLFKLPILINLSITTITQKSYESKLDAWIFANLKKKENLRLHSSIISSVRFPSFPFQFHADFLFEKIKKDRFLIQPLKKSPLRLYLFWKK